MRTTRVTVLGALLALLALPLAGCDGDGPGDSAPPFRMSDEECVHLVEIETEHVRLDSVDGPSAAQVLLDTANPTGADLADYTLLLEVEQSFENLLARRVVIEEVTTVLADAETGESYESSYELEEPFELAPHETRSLTFVVKVPGSSVSPGFLWKLVSEAALGMTIAPTVRLRVLDSDNCGYPDGIVLRADEGTLDVERADPSSDIDPLLEVFGAVLKVAAHA